MVVCLCKLFCGLFLGRLILWKFGKNLSFSKSEAYLSGVQKSYLKENLNSLIIFSSDSIQDRVNFSSSKERARQGHEGYSVKPHIIFWPWGKGLLLGQGSVEGVIRYYCQVFLWVSNNVSFLARCIISVVALSVCFLISLLFCSKWFISQPLIFTFLCIRFSSPVCHGREGIEWAAA